MTNLKLTKEQIEALRSIDAALADKLESGEAVTLERAVERWEPKVGAFYVHCSGNVGQADSEERCRIYGVERQTLKAAERLAHDQRIFNRLHAYREEFAPGYVVPPAGEKSWTVYIDKDVEWYCLMSTTNRSPTSIYMPYDVCQALCDKLNSGEVVL